MPARRRPAGHNDPSRPQIFSPDEWSKIVEELSLSPRQAEVVGRVMQSQGDKEIGVALKISESTVRKHLIAAKRRLTLKVRLPAEDRVAVVYGVFWVFRQVIETKRLVTTDGQASYDGRSIA